MKKIKSLTAKNIRFIWLFLLGNSLVAKASDILNSSTTIQNVTDLYSQTGQNMSELYKFGSAALVFGALLVGMYLIVASLLEGNRTGRFGAFFFWLFLTIGVLTLAIVMGVTVYSASGDFNSMTPTN